LSVSARVGVVAFAHDRPAQVDDRGRERAGCGVNVLPVLGRQPRHARRAFGASQRQGHERQANRSHVDRGGVADSLSGGRSQSFCWV